MCGRSVVSVCMSGGGGPADASGPTCNYDNTHAHQSAYDRTITTHPTHPHPSLCNPPPPLPSTTPGGTHATQGNGHTIHTPQTQVGGGGAHKKDGAPQQKVAICSHRGSYPRSGHPSHRLGRVPLCRYGVSTVGARLRWHNLGQEE